MEGGGGTSAGATPGGVAAPGAVTGGVAAAAAAASVVSGRVSVSRSIRLKAKTPSLPSTVAAQTSSFPTAPMVSLRAAFFSPAPKVAVTTAVGCSRPYSGLAGPSQRTARSVAMLLAIACAFAWITVPSPFVSFHFASLSRSNDMEPWAGCAISRAEISSGLSLKRIGSCSWIVVVGMPLSTVAGTATTNGSLSSLAKTRSLSVWPKSTVTIGFSPALVSAVFSEA